VVYIRGARAPYQYQHHLVSRQIRTRNKKASTERSEGRFAPKFSSVTRQHHHPALVHKRHPEFCINKNISCGEAPHHHHNYQPPIHSASPGKHFASPYQHLSLYSYFRNRITSESNHNEQPKDKTGNPHQGLAQTP
jgi:hypothetical protein